MSQEHFHYDSVIVGAGPAGLACAIRLKQLSPHHRICLLEKGVQIGAHILSGAVFDARALDELLPGWKKYNPPVHILARKDYFLYLTQKKSYRLPTPLPLKNTGNYLIRLSLVCQWLGEIANSLGIEIYTGFAAAELIFDSNSPKLLGVKTGAKGLDKNYQKTSRYQPGIALTADQIIFAEGCRGQLSQQIISHFKLDKKSAPQKYGLGLKEIWRINNAYYEPGKIIHTIGFPLDHTDYGGGFLYHIDNQHIALGFIIGLDYANIYLDPYEEFQQFKRHPDIQKLLLNAKRTHYGAKTLVEGGYQSLPCLHFPGGLLIGDSAGFLNAAALKGIHYAMKSGMIAAETIILDNDLANFMPRLKQSWLWPAFYKARNIRPAFQYGLWPGLGLSAIDTYIFRGHAPYTLRYHKADYLYARKNKPIIYPKADNRITFDKSYSLLLANIHHDHNQPDHLKFKNNALDQTLYQLNTYRFCPADVYQIHEQKLYIQAQNCLHCKACDIKDITQNIIWTTPEGGSGPNFLGM